MIKYVFEFNYDIEMFDNKEEALERYNHILGMMVESDKKSLEYYRLYSIKADSEEDIENANDLIDLIDEMIMLYK